MRRLVAIATVALAALVGAACNPLATPTGDAPLRYRDPVFTAVTTTTGVVYGHAVNQQNVDQALTLDVYQPTGDTLAKRPAVVWVHGGGFTSGDSTSPEIVDEATTFAKLGYVAVSINYRLVSPGCSAATPTASCLTGITWAQQDAQTAVRFLREQAATYRIDTNRIAIGGSSAGAITALNVAFSGENPGPGDHQGYSSKVSAAQSISGSELTASTVGAGDAATLLFHGTADPLVPYSWAQSTVTEAQDAGLVTTLVTWTGAGHVPYVQHRQEILDDTTNFFYNMMGLVNAAR